MRGRCRRLDEESAEQLPKWKVLRKVERRWLVCSAEAMSREQEQEDYRKGGVGSGSNKAIVELEGASDRPMQCAEYLENGQPRH